MHFDKPARMASGASQKSSALGICIYYAVCQEAPFAPMSTQAAETGVVQPLARSGKLCAACLGLTSRLTHDFYSA